jgi:hypothetical protein
MKPKVAKPALNARCQSELDISPQTLDIHFPWDGGPSDLIAGRVALLLNEL